MAIQVKNQTKSEKIANEFLNQSNFEFTAFCEHDIKGSSPCLCSEPDTINLNQCSDIHWFNIVQTGNLPARDVKISLIHKDEKMNIINIIKNRTLEETMLYKKDKHQFKLGPQAVPITLLNPRKNASVYVLLEYESVYSKIKYKRIYELEYTPIIGPESTPITWINSIKFFDLKLIHLSDSETLTLREILTNKWNKFLMHLNIKRTLEMHEWIWDL